VRTQPEVIFRLAAAVEDWPRLLPHYRFVRVLAADGTNQRTVEMAARRDLIGRVGLPLRWRAIQTLYPSDTRIEFEHIGGASRGMLVTWTINARSASLVARDLERSASLVASNVERSASLVASDVEIRHVFSPAWPVPEDFIRKFVGEFIVNGVARRTLAHLAAIAERPS
jgi:ribosome-associated toxin RatA of RatAB toxin-antitoxin module